MPSPRVETVWTPVEYVCTAENEYDNPYLAVETVATVSHEDGTTYELPGFWDGDSTWRFRFAPPRVGEWTVSITSNTDDAGLTHESSFVATEYEGPNAIRRHGFLSTDDRSLVHDDGTEFFWLADTAWSAGAKATPGEWQRFVSTRREQGFNVVQINSLPQWDASRPWDRFPFGHEWDLDAPDPTYFQSLDTLVSMAYDHGLVPALVALWFNYVPGTWPDWDNDADRHPFSTEQAARFGRYLAARYGSYGTVWLVSGDTNYDEDDPAALDVYTAAAEAIADSVTHPLQTTHMVGGQATPETVLERDWVDFHLYQSSHVTDLERPINLAIECRDRDGQPVINGEPPYERHGYFDHPGKRISRETVRKAGWLSVFAGGTAGLTYGGHGIWQWHRPGERFGGADRIGMPDPWEETLDYRGARDYGSLRSFIAEYDCNTLEPTQDVITDAPPLTRCLKDETTGDVLVYAATAHELTLDRGQLNVIASARWIHPGEWTSVPATFDDDGETVTVAPPPWSGDGILVISD